MPFVAEIWNVPRVLECLAPCCTYTAQYKPNPASSNSGTQWTNWESWTPLRQHRASQRLCAGRASTKHPPGVWTASCSHTQSALSKLATDLGRVSWGLFAQQKHYYISRFVLVSKQGWPWGASVAALCERARTLWEEADLSFLTACLPTSMPALAWFFKAFQGFFHSPRLNSECLKEEFLHGNSCWKTKRRTKLTFTTKSSDAWIIANATQDTIEQNSSALSLPQTKPPRVLYMSSLPLWSPGLTADSNSQQELDNFPPAGDFYSAKGESSLKTVRKESVSVGNGLSNHIPVLEVRMTRICQLQEMLQTPHSRCKDLCFAPIVLPDKWDRWCLSWQALPAQGGWVQNCSSEHRCCWNAFPCSFTLNLGRSLVNTRLNHSNHFHSDSLVVPHTVQAWARRQNLDPSCTTA